MSKAPKSTDLHNPPTPHIVTIVLVALALAAIITAVHWPALSAQAFALDDSQYLANNPLVQNPSWTSARRFLTEVLDPSTVRGYYQPLSMISLMLDYAAGGNIDNLTPFHRTSLALHVANALMIMMLLYLLFRCLPAAAAAALLFALHPMTVETIAWVSERKTPLATFFALAAMIFYVRYAQTIRLKMYALALVAFALALLAKPTAVALPIVMLLLDYWPLSRISKRALLEKIPFLLLAVAAAAITFFSQYRTSLLEMPTQLTAWKIPLLICHNIFFYLAHIFYPVNLTSHYPIYQPFDLSQPMILVGLIATVLLTIVLLVSWRRSRTFLTGALIFLITILPTMGIVKFTNVVAADKFAYLPALGLLLILAHLLSRLSQNTATTRRLPTRSIILILLVLLLASTETLLTRRYLAKWQDTETLWRHMTQTTPKVVGLRNTFGVILAQKGDFLGAQAEYHQALAMQPDHADTLNNLAWLLATHHQPKFRDGPQAVRIAEQVCQATRRQSPATLDTLAAAYAETGQFEEAIKTAQLALELADQTHDPALAEEIKQRLKSYQQRRPYRQHPTPRPLL